MCERLSLRDCGVAYLSRARVSRRGCLSETRIHRDHIAETEGNSRGTDMLESFEKETYWRRRAGPGYRVGARGARHAGARPKSEQSRARSALMRLTSVSQGSVWKRCPFRQSVEAVDAPSSTRSLSIARFWVLWKKGAFCRANALVGARGEEGFGLRGGGGRAGRRRAFGQGGEGCAGEGGGRRGRGRFCGGLWGADRGVRATQAALGRGVVRGFMRRAASARRAHRRHLLVLSKARRWTWKFRAFSQVRSLSLSRGLSSVSFDLGDTSRSVFLKSLSRYIEVARTVRHASFVSSNFSSVPLNSLPKHAAGTQAGAAARELGARARGALPLECRGERRGLLGGGVA